MLALEASEAALLMLRKLSTRFTLFSGLGASFGKNTARTPSTQMMGRMMRLATMSSAMHMYRPLQFVKRGSGMQQTSNGSRALETA
jgi:hypothetical protein